MRPRGRIQALAGGAALLVFLFLLLALRMRNWVPFVAGAGTYLALLWQWRPRRAPRRVALPPGVSGEDYRAALDALATARRELAALVALAPSRDVPMIRRMGELVEAIRRHHEANPAHVARTRVFVRHTLDRMVAAVAGYVDLAKRAGPGDARLAGVAREIADFIPVLEKIDRACIDNDLMALEINVEVLNDQLGRDREM